MQSLTLERRRLARDRNCNRDDAPSHLFKHFRMDFPVDLFVERLARPWFRLGACDHQTSS